MTFSPDTTVIGSIQAALAAIVRNQITGLTQVFDEEPDTELPNGGVILPLSGFEVLDDTNGKLTVKVTFNVTYCVRRSKSGAEIRACKQYILPFLQCFSDWANQDLSNLVRSVTPKRGAIAIINWNDMPYRALVTPVEVLTEFNIPIV